MANSFAKTIDILWEEFVEGYDAGCVISRAAPSMNPAPKEMQRAGDVFYQPQTYNATVVQGLDVSAAVQTDVIQRMVPTVYRQPDNVVFNLDSKAMRDPVTMKMQGEAAALRLSAEIDKNLYNTVAREAGIVVKRVGPLDWDSAGTAEALMLSRGIGIGRERKLFMNPFDWKDLAKDLGSRQTLEGVPLNAYERSKVPAVAGFDTFRTDNQAVITAAGSIATGTTLATAAALVPAAIGPDGITPQDNTQMTVTLAGAGIATGKVGDAFTIAGVYAVNQIDKSDTGKLMTFRIVGGVSPNYIISPAIIPTGPYQNVTAAGAAGAALTFLNTATAPADCFWAQGAVELAYGKLAFPADEGPAVRTANTKNGVPLIMAYTFNSLTAVATIRFTTLYATTVLEPEQCGIILANQV